MSELPWLVADIGGTNARFGLVTAPGEAPSRVAVLAGADYASLPDAVAAYLAEHAGGVRPGAACVAVAGPIDGDRYQLTNLPWEGSITELGLPYTALLNDFEALAVSLPHLGDDDLVTLGGPAPRVKTAPGVSAPVLEVNAPPTPEVSAVPAPEVSAVPALGVNAGPVLGGKAASAHGVKAVLGPGTGLGVAGLVPSDRGWIPVPGEGGHVSVPVHDEREREIVRALHAQGLAHVEAEHVLSGPGLVRLHRALALVHGVDGGELTVSDIVARMDDSLCAETVEVFCSMLGTFAGNVALTLGARGGVYIGGGVLPRIVERVRASAFRARFEQSPSMSGYLSAIATSLIVAPQPALTGAAAWLTQQLSRRSVYEPA